MARSTRHSTRQRETGTRSITLVVFVFAAAMLVGALLQRAETAHAKPTVGVCRAHHAQRDRTTCIIRVVFHPYGEQALRVAWCESRFDVNARNGQYRGLFQMGASERARFGHGRTVLAQSRAARRYFDLAGWGPWACRP